MRNIKKVFDNKKLTKRLTAKGYGESQLIILDAQTEEQHQVNRRTEFKILEIGGKKPVDEETTEEQSVDDEDRFFDGDGE